MDTKDLHSIWNAPDNSLLTTKQYTVRLPIIVAAQLAALGATKVVGVPCSQRVLLSRLMDLVPHKPDPEADADFTPLPSTLAGLVEAAGGQRSFFQRLSDWVVPSFLRGGSPSLRS